MVSLAPGWVVFFELGFLVGLDLWNSPSLEDDADGLVEDLLESFLGEGTALDVLAAELGDDLLRLGGIGRGVCYHGVLDHLGVVGDAEVDFVADEDLGDLGHLLLQLHVPLEIVTMGSTFLTALLNEACSSTLNATRNTSLCG